MSVAFDHLMVIVADEAAAAQEFSQRGFTVTPRSELPGMANRLVCFPSSEPYAACFVELLAVERPDDVTPRIRSFVGSLLGPAAVVLAVPDLSVLQRRLSESGASAFGPVEIRRRWTLSTGETLDVALDILIGDDNSLPFKWAAVQHHTVEHYQRTEFTLHANRFGSLSAVAISVEDPGFIARQIETMFGTAYRRCESENARLLLLPNGQSISSQKLVFAGVILQGTLDDINLDNVTYNLMSHSGKGNGVEAMDLGNLKLFRC